MAKLTNSVGQGADVKPLGGTDVHMLGQLCGIRRLCLKAAWLSVVLWLAQVLNNSANCEVGKP